MRPRLIFMFVLAAFFAGAAALVAKNWVDSQTERHADSSVDTKPVAVAAIEIAFGRKLEETDVKLVDWPRNSVPEGAHSDVVEVIGKIAKRSFVPGEALVESRLSEHLGGSTLSALISPGKRAVSVRVNDVVGVAGFVLPGNYIDVLATRRESNSRAKTRTVLQNLKVLAVDQEASPDQEGPAVVRAVTLELTPDQAEELVKAEEEGTIQLSLRSPLDASIVAAKPPPPPPEVKPAPKPVAKVTPPPKRRVRRPPPRSSVGVIAWGAVEEVVCKDKAC